MASRFAHENFAHSIKSDALRDQHLRALHALESIAEVVHFDVQARTQFEHSVGCGARVLFNALSRLQHDFSTVFCQKDEPELVTFRNLNSLLEPKFIHPKFEG